MSSQMAVRSVQIVFVFAGAMLFSACASTTQSNDAPITSSTTANVNGMAITDDMIGRSRGTMHLEHPAKDPKYGYSQTNPIKIGGGFGDGSDRTYRYLNSLRGAGGEAVKYSRVGTCCPFKTPNSPFEGEGLLEVYEINGAQRLYFDWYDEEEPLIPVGLTAVR